MPQRKKILFRVFVAGLKNEARLGAQAYVCINLLSVVTIDTLTYWNRTNDGKNDWGKTHYLPTGG